MARFALLFIIGGGVLAYFGIQEFRVSQGTSSEAAAVELSALESGQQPASTYVQIGKHLAMYHTVVYSYNKGKYDNSAPTDATSISFCYYPIISGNHAWMKEVLALQDKHNGKIPDDVPDPVLRDFAVLVKTSRFKTLGAIPKFPGDEQNVKGLIINRIAALSSEEERLLREGIPTFDSAKVLILQDGRQPSSMLAWLGMTGGGAALILIGLASFFVRPKGQ